jgi:hypothetical protein
MSKITEVLERVAALEAVVRIGNGGPPLDDDEPPPPKPGLLPDRLVAQRYKVHVRTLARWDENPDLNLPPPTYILRRRYRSVEALDKWDRANARKVADPHNPHRDCAQALPRAQRGRFVKPAEALSECAQAPPRAGVGARCSPNKNRDEL